MRKLESDVYVHDILYNSLIPNTFDLQTEHMREIDRPNCRYLYDF